MKFKEFLAEAKTQAKTEGGTKLDNFMADYHAGTAGHPWYHRMSIWNDSVGIELSKWQGMIHISSIMSFDEKNVGNASKALKWLTDLADKHQVKMDLSVQPIKNAGAREGKNLNKSQLKSWYKRNGFKPVGGDHMMREPNEIQ